jgi:hypothetical protein
VFDGSSDQHQVLRHVSEYRRYAIVSSLDLANAARKLQAMTGRSRGQSA